MKLNQLLLKLRKRRKVDSPTGGEFRRNTVLHSFANSVRQRTHQKSRRRRKLLKYFFILVLAVVMAGIFFSQFSFSTEIVMNKASKSVDLSEYEKAFASYYSERPFQRFRPFTNNPALTNFIQMSQPEVQSVEPSGVAGVGKMRYKLIMREPIAKWRIAGHDYFVDKHGVVFGKNLFAAPTVTVVDKSGIKAQSGNAIASDRMLAFVGKAVSVLSESGFKIEQVVLPAESIRTIEINSAGNPRVVMAVDRPISYQVDAMNRGVKYLKSSKQSVKYIDVRVEGKIFYK